MFSGLISKSVIVDNITLLIPSKLLNNEILILISHGSGGVGDAEFAAAEFFLQHGYKVALNDYFSPYGIERLWWNYEEKFQDSYNVSFNDLLSLKHSFEEKLVHIGFSLGGFFGILNSEKFLLNFCFYPGIVCFSESHVKKNYSNTTVFSAGNDNWCDGYREFSKYCHIPPIEILLKDHFHGFMIPEKNKQFTVAKYNFPLEAISEDDFKQLKPNHLELSNKFGYTPTDVLLLHQKTTQKRCLNYIKTRIENL